MSSSSVPSPSDLIASFPRNPLPAVSEDVTYPELTELRKAIKENYESIESARGGGDNGLLGGASHDIWYLTIAPGTPFTLPTNPGAPPVVAGANQVDAANAVRIYNEEKREWQEWCNIERATKLQLAASVPESILSGAKGVARTFNGVRVRDIISFLFTNYAEITQQDLIANRQRLTDEWDPNRPFTDLTTRVQEVQEIATDGRRPISDNDAIDAIYTVIYTTGIFFDACEEWNDKTTADKTWVNFQTHFVKAQRKTRLRQKATAKQGGFHGANAVVDERIQHTEEALINMITSEKEDKKLITLQSETIAAQMRVIADLTEQVKNLQNKNGVGNGNDNGNGGGGGKGAKWVNGKHIWDKGHYFWSHGFLVRAEHTSATCTKQKEGHKVEATRENIMGGCTYGKART
jgi:hypothetical protein